MYAHHRKVGMDGMLTISAPYLSSPGFMSQSGNQLLLLRFLLYFFAILGYFLILFKKSTFQNHSNINRLQTIFPLHPIYLM
jgi:hypothetical protein